MKKWMIMLLVCMGLTGICGCADAAADSENQFQIYYVNNKETRVFAQDCRLEADGEDTQAQLEEVLGYLSRTPDKLEYKPPLTMGFELLSYDLNEGNLTLDVDEHYRELLPTTEVLVRAALVRTLTQIKGIHYIAFTVRGEPLTDKLGNLLGMMSADQFIDNAGSEINAMEEVNIKLYFADETGNGLIVVGRTFRYSTNISMEKLIVENLINGPTDQVPEAFPTINPDTKVLSTMVKDGICYVDLDNAFLTQLYNVSADVALYSITNSLVELPNVNKVQISVNGETDILYRETTSLTTILERNLDLVAAAQ